MVKPTAHETNPVPRGLSREGAARYVGRSPAAFSDWVRRGIMPGPIPGTHVWDRKAIDEALDRASGLSQGELSSLEQRKRNRVRKT